MDGAVLVVDRAGITFGVERCGNLCVMECPGGCGEYSV